MYLSSDSHILCCREANKALDQFVESVHGVSKDSFLKTLLRGDHTNPKHAEVVFLLKVRSSLLTPCHVFIINLL